VERMRRGLVAVPGTASVLFFMSAIFDYSSGYRQQFPSHDGSMALISLGMEPATTASAKRFLLAKLEEQASHDGVPLSDIEKRMFLFSEEAGSEKMQALAEEFDATYDDADYERKVSKLLKAAFRRDKQTSDAATAWKQSLAALKDTDFYGLVMVQQAGLPFSRRSVAGDIGLGIDAFLELVPVAGIALAVGIPGFLIVFDPFQWGLIHSQWTRLALLPVFVFGVWWAVGKYSESEFRQPRKLR